MMGVMAKVDYTCKPSAYESEIHPSHKSKICTLCISPLQGGQIYASVNYKCCRIYVYAGYGNEFVNGCLSIHSQ